MSVRTETIYNGEFGGLSDTEHSGPKNSFFRAVGLDFHSEPGRIKVQQKLTKNSGSTVTEFCRVAISASNGYTFWFSYTSGKIWARSSAGTWTLAYTTAPAAGSAGCLGAKEFNGQIYWATQSRLHRIAIANADDSWASVSADWATFEVTDASWHPMAEQSQILFIGDANKVASVDSSGNFDGNALDIKTPHRIKAIAPFGIDIVIGTFVATTFSKTEIIRWDTTSTSWNILDTIEETGVNSFIVDDNYLYAQAGRAGNIYFYNGEQLEKFVKIPGDFTNVKYGEVYSGSAANFLGRPVFGFSNSPEAGNSTGNPALEGVYSLGAYSRNYPKTLDLSWVISEAVTSGIEIGAIIVEDYNLFVAWKNGSTYGVDLIDWSNKYASAYLESTMLETNNRVKRKVLSEVFSHYISLPASTGVTFTYQNNHAGSYSALLGAVATQDSTENKIYDDTSVFDIGALQLKAAFTVSGNDAPELETLGYKIS